MKARFMKDQPMLATSVNWFRGPWFKSCASPSAFQRARQLRLGHARPAGDVAALGLFVKFGPRGGGRAACAATRLALAFRPRLAGRAAPFLALRLAQIL